MAITGAALQAALGTNPMNAQVVREFGVEGTFQGWYIVGNQDGAGRSRFINTTAADNAATQATAVLAALNA
jgi:hypothetical protein